MCRPYRSATLPLVLLLLTLLQGCVNRLPTSTDWQQAMDAGLWQAEGKIGLIYDNKGQSANFNWKNERDNYIIALYGPLGQGRVQLSKHQGRYAVNDKHGQHSAASAEALLQQQLGWSIPVTGLQYWIRGATNPNAAVDAKQHDISGRIDLLEQQGWHITYHRYHNSDDQPLLPKKIIAKRESLKLTIIIKKWHLPIRH